MYHKLNNGLDTELLREEMERLFSESHNTYQLVMDRVKFYIDLLEEHYGGEHRNIESDGGFVLLFTESNTDNERKRILDYYGLKAEEAEVREIICEDEAHSTEWIEELYIMTEFHIIMIFPRKKGGV